MLINLAVLLFGTAGLFARWISLPAVCIAFGRVLFSSCALALFLFFAKASFRTKSRKDAVMLVAAGAVLGLHWWSFLASVQLSTVAVGTVTFSSFPLFVVFLEPLLTQKRPVKRNILLALLILAGVCVTVPEFSFENRMFRGVAVGVLSAFLYALLTLMNKRFTDTYSSTLTAFYEQSAAALVLMPFALSAGFHPSPKDLSLLAFLGIFTTAAAHSLFIRSLKDVPAQTAGICSSMETVYGILLAFLFLKEVPSVREIAGACIIITAVILSQRGTDS